MCKRIVITIGRSLQIALCLIPAMIFGAFAQSQGELSLQGTIGTQSELYSIAGISTDLRGNVYITDVLDYAVKKFDAMGRLLARVGHRGYGPGEFRAPAYSVFCRDTLAVLQVEDPRVQIFGRDLAYLGEFSVPDALPIDIACMRKGTLAIAIIADSTHGGVWVYPNMRGRSPSRLVFEETGRRQPLYAATRIGIRDDGTVVAAYLFLNRVELYTRKGKFLRRFAVPVMAEGGEEADETKVPEKTYIRRVLTPADGKILLVGGTEAPHPGRDIFLFNKKGVYLGMRTLPEKARVMCIGGRGSLFAAEEFSTSVRKYVIR